MYKVWHSTESLRCFVVRKEKPAIITLIKGNGDHSEVRDKFCLNIRKLGGATY